MAYCKNQENTIFCRALKQLSFIEFTEKFRILEMYIRRTIHQFGKLPKVKAQKFPTVPPFLNKEQILALKPAVADGAC